MDGGRRDMARGLEYNMGKVSCKPVNDEMDLAMLTSYFCVYTIVRMA